ncbi:MAG: ABC transporter ATP-binding protein [Bacillota bacterium]
MSLFSAKNISKYYQGEPVIENVSIEVEKGEVVCLLGKSGVGKSTFFNVLSGLETPDSGSVFLDGLDITGLPGKVSYMLQSDLLLPFKTVIDNVALPLIIGGMPTRSARIEAAKYFDDFGLAGYERKYPNQISGGMRQRAALLRTFLNHKAVILLDEPFSALDSFTKTEMHDWFKGIVAKFGLTALFITHDVEEAHLLSDRIYTMSGRPGRI